MRKSKIFAKAVFSKVAGLKTRNVKQGHGSFITMEFGKDVEFIRKIKGKLIKNVRGEWYFFVYMCAWRIDEKNNPIAGCEDSREIIERALKKIENKKLINVQILNNAYDLKLKFENSINFLLFSIYTKEEDAEHWMLYAPENKVLSAGPGITLTYENSGYTAPVD